MPRGGTSSCGRIGGEEGVAELAGHYPMSFAAVQKHVAVLERAGLVTKERSGRRKVVRTNLEGLRVARGLLDQYEALWRGRIERMTDLITSSEGDRPMTVTAVQQGRRRPDHDRDRRVRRVAGARLAAVGRSAPARALVGPADLPRHVHGPRPGSGQPRRVPHDRARPATSRAATGTSSRPIRRVGWSSAMGSPTTTVAERRLPAERGPGDDRADRRRDAHGCRSRATSRAPRPWSRSSPWAWRRA